MSLPYEHNFQMYLVSWIDLFGLQKSALIVLTECSSARQTCVGNCTGDVLGRLLDLFVSLTDPVYLAERAPEIVCFLPTESWKVLETYFTHYSGRISRLKS